MSIASKEAFVSRRRTMRAFVLLGAFSLCMLAQPSRSHETSTTTHRNAAVRTVATMQQHDNQGRRKQDCDS